MLNGNGYLLKPQKALHLFKELEKKKPKCFGKQYVLDIKEDGWFGYFCLNTGTVHVSTNGREPTSCLELADNMSKDFENLVYEDTPSFLLFEIRVRGVEDFYTTNGILNRKQICPDVYIIVHDFVQPVDGIDKTKYKHRRNAAYNYFKCLNITDAEWQDNRGLSFDKDKWQAQAEKAWDEGHEGLILRDVNAPYEEGKRNNSLMKIKMECDADLVVVGMKAGEGKYAHTLGALICRTKDGTAHDISGMTDAERDLWWLTPSTIMGKVIEIKAMKRNPDGTFREPRYQHVRDDKTVKDID